MTRFLDKSFSTYAPGDDTYRDNWERTFGKRGCSECLLKDGHKLQCSVGRRTSEGQSQSPSARAERRRLRVKHPLGACCLAGRCDGEDCPCPCHPGKSDEPERDPGEDRRERVVCRTDEGADVDAVLFVPRRESPRTAEQNRTRHGVREVMGLPTEASPNASATPPDSLVASVVAAAKAYGFDRPLSDPDEEAKRQLEQTNYDRLGMALRRLIESRPPPERCEGWACVRCVGGLHGKCTEKDCPCDCFNVLRAGPSSSSAQSKKPEPPKEPELECGCTTHQFGCLSRRF